MPLTECTGPTGFDTEPHGAGNQELPDVVTPEIYMDMFTHNTATKTILLIEAALIGTAPIPSGEGSYLRVEVPIVVNGRVGSIVTQRYTDVGWKNVTLVRMTDTSKSLFTAYFP
ncbi:hypothetical protein MZD04_gp279 [Pseudomonas phage Psa21]|uniref:Uncharacterized protein n=1 Tax=Pseudomonas phage Psa21 TaxID=2530023 RepID=A0A481W5N2_9CAUD|nr:hypothetical protein MZD04_gp279 [Pseudomonas phage Psa21]QBJ02805.1 hypothetical protein PSA21_279 [Pseudomonas phage Psa21]